MAALPSWPQPQPALLAGRYRRTAADFKVIETLGWQPVGEGEHLLLEIEKRHSNTAWVARRLAQRARCAPSEVGYCGDKDRHGLTTQWFSIRDPKQALCWQVGDGEGRFEVGAEGEEAWRILTLARHDRKLRRGDHAGNRFRLALDLAAGPADARLCAAVVERLRGGVANYFGPQRFGRDGGNLLRVKTWIADGRLPGRGPERARILSTARSWLFNDVLAERIVSIGLAAELDGDVIVDGSPTGPLWGRGRSPASGAAAALEQRALAPHRACCDRLEHAGVTQQRRALRLTVGDLHVAAAEQGLELHFMLPAGAFATAVLAALGTFTDAAVQGGSIEGQ